MVSVSCEFLDSYFFIKTENKKGSTYLKRNMLFFRTFFEILIRDCSRKFLFEILEES